MEFNTNHGSEILINLNKERTTTRRFCDFTIKAGREEFHVHKNVIGIFSTFFKTLLTNDVTEKYANEVTIKEVSSTIMGLILSFIYTSRITITSENVCPLIEAAELLQIPHLKECCAKFLNEHLNEDNCLKIKTYANGYNIKTLSGEVDQFISKNLTSVLKGEDCCNLDIGDISKILKLESEEESIYEYKYNALIKWVKHDVAQRGAYFNELFGLLDLRYFSKSFLNTVVMAEELVMESKDCLRWLSRALTVQLPETSRQKKSQSNSHSGDILVIGGESCAQNVVKYCVETKQWVNMPNASVFRSHASAVNYQQRIYLMGGSGAGTTHSSVEILNLRKHTLKWEMCQTSMTEKRSYFGAALLNDMIYCVGGFNPSHLSSVECYDLNVGKWLVKNKMINARHYMALAATEGKLFVIGGVNIKGLPMTLAECFDSETGIWKHISPLKTHRYGLCAAALNGEVYAIGGYDGQLRPLSSVEKYNLASNQWSDNIASMNEKRFGAATCVVNGRIYVFGGQNAKTVEVFDPERNKWEIEANMDQVRAFPSVVSI